MNARIIKTAYGTLINFVDRYMGKRSLYGESEVMNYAVDPRYPVIEIRHHDNLGDEFMDAVRRITNASEIVTLCKANNDPSGLEGALAEMEAAIEEIHDATRKTVAVFGMKKVYEKRQFDGAHDPVTTSMFSEEQEPELQAA